MQSVVRGVSEEFCFCWTFSVVLVCEFSLALYLSLSLSLSLSLTLSLSLSLSLILSPFPSLVPSFRPAVQMSLFSYHATANVYDWSVSAAIFFLKYFFCQKILLYILQKRDEFSFNLLRGIRIRMNE